MRQLHVNNENAYVIHRSFKFSQTHRHNYFVRRQYNLVNSCNCRNQERLHIVPKHDRKMTPTDIRLHLKLRIKKIRIVI